MTGRVVRIEETPAEQEVRMAQKLVDSLTGSVERATNARERANKALEELEAELADAIYKLEELNKGVN